MIKSHHKKLLLSSLFMNLFLLGCDSKFEMTKTETTTDNSGITQSITSHTTTDNNDTVTHIKVQSSSAYYPGSISMNGDTIDFKNNKMYINNKEVDVNTEKGVSVSTNHQQTVINGKPVDNKADTIKDINIVLIGKNVKIPVTSLNNLSSHFNITQKCSDSDNSYFLIDAALEPYILKDIINAGTLNLKTGNYTIKGKINVELFTPPLKDIDYNGYGIVHLSCIDKDSFSLVNNGIGKILVDNIDTNHVKVSQSGSGIITLEGKNINTLYSVNNGVGAINIHTKVKNAQLENSGVGIIYAKEVGVLESQNSGIGSIKVDKTDKIIRQEKNALDSMFNNTDE